MAIKEYVPGTRFPGVIGRTVDVSEPAWPAPTRAKPGSPNVLFVVLDDTGFGHLGCYGSPIATPNIDALAAGGLRYNNMHTTALCSPSRACIITGRNHHSNHLACLTNGSTGYPGSDGYIPFENGFLSEILLQNGYNTYAVGKWHLAPEETMTAAGPYDRWPLGRGFERYYGFLGGDTHQYYPELIRDNSQTEPETTPEEGYHLTPDLVERAKAMIADAKQVAPNKPFFMYFAPGAMHSPHHVPKEWADRYAGQFDAGWDAYRKQVFEKQQQLGLVPANANLSPHDPDVQEWDSLGPDERRVYARMMEVFAGFLTHTDHYIGELIGFLKDLGEYDNTLIMLVSDNGSSAEGGPHGSVNECRFFNNVPDTMEENLAALDDLGGPKFLNHFPWGWTHAGNTPFRRWKRETYRGGVSDPFIVALAHRYQGTRRGAHAVRPRHRHGPDSPGSARHRAAGHHSRRHAVSDRGSEPRRHLRRRQRAGQARHAVFRDDGAPVALPRRLARRLPVAGAVVRGFGPRVRRLRFPTTCSTQLDAKGWELYNLAEDFAETNNLAAKEPARLIAMIGMWYNEAGKYNVLPLDSRGIARIAEERPQIAVDRSRYVLYPGTQSVVASAAPKILNRHYSITAEVDVPQESAEGVLLSMGGNDGGFSFYVQGGKLCFAFNYVAIDCFYVKSHRAVPAGHHFLSMEFEPTGKPDIKNGKGAPGVVKLFVDGEEIGKGTLPVTSPVRLAQGGAMLVGADTGAAVTPEYKAPFRFTGKVFRVIVDISGEHVVDYESEMRIALAKQ